MRILAIVMTLGLLASVGQGASRGGRPRPPAHHPTTARQAAHPTVHHASPRPAKVNHQKHSAPVKAHKSTTVKRTTPRKQNFARPARTSVRRPPARIVSRPASATRSRVRSSINHRRNNVNYARYRHRPRRLTHSTRSTGNWLRGVVVSSRRGSGLRSGTFTIQTRRSSGRVGGRLATLRKRGQGRSSLHTFQVGQNTRFNPGRANLASLHRGVSVAVLTSGNNSRFARSVQILNGSSTRGRTARLP